MFSIKVFLENNLDKFQRAYTAVYGPHIDSLRNLFWTELDDIKENWVGAWVVGGDFNVIRSRSEKKGVSFHYNTSVRFNDWILNNELID